MYQDYFGLKEQAFSIAVDPRYLYMSRQHQEALAHLLYGVQGGGFVMLSGEVGTGKTTIIRKLLEKLPDNTDIAIILNPMANVIELLSAICDELAIEYDSDKATVKSLTDALYHFLLANHGRGRNTVLLIDEAQLLAPEVLEQLRLLTNLETSAKKLLQIVLVGQPELNRLLSQPRLRQLSQRITARFHLKPLSLQETRSYIHHRLQVAGMPAERNPFTPASIRRIHTLTGGIPRRINVLCERILIGTYGHNKKRVDRQILQLAWSEVTGEPVKEKRRWILPALASGAVATSLVLAGVLILQQQPGTTPAQQPAPPMAEPAPSAAASQNSAPLPAPATPTAEPEPYFSSLFSAQAVLFEYLNLPADAGSHPCWSLREEWVCEKADVEDWSGLREVNRPAVLSLLTPERFKRYVPLVSLAGDEATVLVPYGSPAQGHREKQVSLTELGSRWNGEIFYLWRRPPEYREPLLRQQRHPTIAWVAGQFAQMDGRDQPMTDDYFNDRLETRIQIFQRRHGLEPDGIIGKLTLLKLNEVMQLEATLTPAGS